MLNRAIILVLAYIMYGCTYEVAENPGDDMTVRATGWSQSGQIKPGGGTNSGVLLTATFGEQENYTVQFAVQDPNSISTLIGTDRVLIRAEITWIVNGQHIRRVVDVGSGVSVTGCAESVVVKAYDASTISSPAAVPVTVTVTVVKGSRASVEKPPIYALDDFNVGPGADAVSFDVPPDAGAILLFVGISPNTIGTAIGAYDVLVLQTTNGIGSNVLMRYDPRQTDWVPLVPGTKKIVIQTSAAAPQVAIEPIFGIDG